MEVRGPSTDDLVERQAVEPMVVAERRKWSAAARCRFGCCCCMLVFLLTFIALLIARFVARNKDADKYRGPFIEALADASVCHNSAINTSCGATCAVELGANATMFDLSPAESPLFGFIFTQLINQSSDNMEDILGGAHVVFEDAGSCMHKFLINLPGAYPRTSSHRSTSTQYGIKEGRILDTILIGTDSKNMSWFQLEGAAWDPKHDIPSSFNHALDMFLYILTRKQMGPLGTSPHTDKHPLHFPQPLRSELFCPQACHRISV